MQVRSGRSTLGRTGPSRSSRGLGEPPVRKTPTFFRAPTPGDWWGQSPDRRRPVGASDSQLVGEASSLSRAAARPSQEARPGRVRVPSARPSKLGVARHKVRTTGAAHNCAPKGKPPSRLGIACPRVQRGCGLQAAQSRPLLHRLRASLGDGAR